MAELLDILDAFAMPLKVGWVVWLAWGIGLVFWHRHDRSSEFVSRRPAAAVRKPFVSRPSMPPRMATRAITAEPVLVTDHVAESDRFVADFEMNTRHRHGTPPNEEQ